MNKPILYTFILSLIVSGVVLVGSYLIANILQNYVIYVGFYPVYPLAWLSPLVRMTGQILAILAFILIFAVRAAR